MKTVVYPVTDVLEGFEVQLERKDMTPHARREVVCQFKDYVGWLKSIGYPVPQEFLELYKKLEK